MRPRRTPLPVLKHTLAAALISSASWAPAAAASCGPLENQYGPFDYVTQKSRLGVVEQHHFTPQVEALIKGATSVSASEDIDYTLRAFPNHHRALLSLVRLAEKKRSSQPVGLGYSVECYFERALRFRPKDSTVRMIYASYLFKDQRDAQANQQLELAAVAAGGNPFTHYNIGLLYLERQNYAQALIHAHKAYAQGFPQPMLREQLQLQGKWKEPN